MKPIEHAIAVRRQLVLNVDDYAPGRYAKTKVLRQGGYEVAEAASGAEALTFLEEHHPDLVMLDVNLPDISGLEVCRRIKENPATASIVVLQTSAAHIQVQNQAQALENGADGYLIEPVDPSLLIATIRSLLRARLAEEALRQANEELKQFSFMLSHELNEPLRMVTSYTQLLARRYKDKLGPDAEEYMNYAVEGATRMQKFINDVLRYSRAANLKPEYRRFSGQTSLHYALKNLTIAIRESGAKITHDPLPELLGDEMGISHVLQNLIGNAIKYRRTGVPPVIHVTVKAENEVWRIGVTDNGIGIEPKYQHQVFGIFQRLHGREISGSGIGLALCKRIVEGHGGLIWVTSNEAGPGSSFYFTLPIEQVH